MIPSLCLWVLVLFVRVVVAVENTYRSESEGQYILALVIDGTIRNVEVSILSQFGDVAAGNCEARY